MAGPFELPRVVSSIDPEATTSPLSTLSTLHSHLHRHQNSWYSPLYFLLIHRFDKFRNPWQSQHQN